MTQVNIQGSDLLVANFDNKLPAVIDSGTSLILVTKDMWVAMMNGFNLTGCKLSSL